MSPEQVKLRVRCDEVSVSVQDNYRQHLVLVLVMNVEKVPLNVLTLDQIFTNHSRELILHEQSQQHM